MFGIASRPAWLVTFTTQPLPCSRIDGKTAFVHASAPKKFVSMTRR